MLPRRAVESALVVSAHRNRPGLARAKAGLSPLAPARRARPDQPSRRVAPTRGCAACQLSIASRHAAHSRVPHSVSSQRALRSPRHSRSGSAVPIDDGRLLLEIAENALDLIQGIAEVFGDLSRQHMGVRQLGRILSLDAVENQQARGHGGFFAMFSLISAVSTPGRRRDRVSWTILRGRFRRKRPLGVPKTPLPTEKGGNYDALSGFGPWWGVAGMVAGPAMNRYR